MKIMIRAHDLGVKGEENIKAELDRRNIDGVQLVVYKAIDGVKQEVGSLSPERASEISDVIKSGGKEIPLIGAYFNPVHPNEEKADRGFKLFREYISLLPSLGCDTVGSESGSYNGDPWIYHPKNHSDEALDRVVETFGELARIASDYKKNIAIEGAFGHVLHTPERLYEAFLRIGRDNVRIIFDLYNYLDISNVDQTYEILDRSLRLFGNKILLYHIKDFFVSEGRLVQCGVGRGELDFDLIIKKIYQNDPDAILVLEGTVGEDIDHALSFLREKINKLTYTK